MWRLISVSPRIPSSFNWYKYVRFPNGILVAISYYARTYRHIEDCQHTFLKPVSRGIEHSVVDHIYHPQTTFGAKVMCFTPVLVSHSVEQSATVYPSM